MLGISLTVDIDDMLSQRLGFPVGVYIKALEEGGAAELAGMRVGDIIIAINDEPVTDADGLRAARDNFKAGDTITVTASRNGVDMNFEVKLQENVPSKVN